MNTDTISSRLKEVRDENQLTQHAMALKLGINERKLSRLEENPKKIDHLVIIKLSKEFGISTSWITDGEGPKYQKPPVTFSQKEYQELEQQIVFLKQQIENLKVLIEDRNYIITVQKELISMLKERMNINEIIRV